MNRFPSERDDIQELIKNIEWSEAKVRKLVELENVEYKVNKKPINLGCFGHYVLFTIFLMGICELSLIFPEITKFVYENEYALIIFIFAYMIIIFLLNRYFIFIKKTLKMDKLKSIPAEREKLIVELTLHSVIPLDYWHPDMLDRLKMYLVNKRADNLKEALNLLEEEIRHNETMRQLKAIGRRIRRLTID
ncbi:hypothetical protein G3578_07040 [Brevibacillus sp. SYP-B805]|uniref:hypothetical protein n=1 Tax=Brevibacillus sp. SYP-B805 TaxID=1578199 RepID=UPI0013E9D656|nr:hypothetical protein [Brevibacillus sp. SYP-B805]NGQ94939.1 hypothetical protein [Brevibacillus sp. SYP-B805]